MTKLKKKLRILVDEQIHSDGWQLAYYYIKLRNYPVPPIPDEIKNITANPLTKKKNKKNIRSI